jgi:hypothetical protein
MFEICLEIYNNFPPLDLTFWRTWPCPVKWLNLAWLKYLLHKWKL